MALTTQQIQSVLADLEQGSSLRKACTNADISHPSRVLELAEKDAVFAGQYTRAKESGLHLLASELLQVSDDMSIDPNSRRIMVDTRKWMLSKMLPKLYGDKLDLSGTITASVTLQVTQQDEKL
jgi:hypothetical protein